MRIGKIVCGYIIIREYPSISVGVNSKGEQKTVQNAYVDLTPAQRDAQDEYWRQYEAKYSPERHPQYW